MPCKGGSDVPDCLPSSGRRPQNQAAGEGVEGRKGRGHHLNEHGHGGHWHFVPHLVVVGKILGGEEAGESDHEAGCVDDGSTGGACERVDCPKAAIVAVPEERSPPWVLNCLLGVGVTASWPWRPRRPGRTGATRGPWRTWRTWRSRAPTVLPLCSHHTNVGWTSHWPRLESRRSCHRGDSV